MAVAVPKNSEAEMKPPGVDAGGFSVLQPKGRRVQGLLKRPRELWLRRTKGTTRHDVVRPAPQALARTQMPLMIGTVNWAGILVAGPALWVIRFTVKRRFDPPSPRDVAGGAVAAPRSRVVTEIGFLAVCLVVASSFAWFQSIFARTLGNAIGLGVFLALVPAAFLTGTEVCAPEKHGFVRGVVVALALTACSVIVYSVRL